ncbi:MAG: hypothetical protein NC548_06135 [Lachnospiraceae bacterium]|nr:hypothetical protein [Lachnospiraceae bacterium]
MSSMRIKEKIRVFQYAFSYLHMKKSSYARVAEKYNVTENEVKKALKETLVELSPRLAAKVSKQATKNSARSLFKKTKS